MEKQAINNPRSNSVSELVERLDKAREAKARLEREIRMDNESLVEALIKAGAYECFSVNISRVKRVFR